MVKTQLRDCGTTAETTSDDRRNKLINSSLMRIRLWVDESGCMVLRSSVFCVCPFAVV